MAKHNLVSKWAVWEKLVDGVIVYSKLCSCGRHCMSFVELQLYNLIFWLEVYKYLCSVFRALLVFGSRHAAFYNFTTYSLSDLSIQIQSFTDLCYWRCTLCWMYNCSVLKSWFWITFKRVGTTYYIKNTNILIKLAKCFIAVAK